MRAFSLLKVLFLFVYMCVFLCVYAMCLHTCAWMCPQKPDEGLRSPGAGVPASCEPLNVGPENRTQIVERALSALSHRVFPQRHEVLATGFLYASKASFKLVILLPQPHVLRGVSCQLVGPLCSPFRPCQVHLFFTKTLEGMCSV